MINVVHGRAEQRHHHVADEFVDRPTISKDDLDHAREVLVQLLDEVLGIALLGDGGKTAQVREEHRHLAAPAAELGEPGIRHQLLVDVPGNVSTEEPADFPLLGVLDEVAVGRAGEERDRRWRGSVAPWPATGRGRRRRARRRSSLPTSAAAPAAATQNGSVADIRPMISAPPAVAATAVHGGAGAMKRFERTLSATLACSWIPGIDAFAERRLKDVERARRPSGRQTQPCP